MGAIGIITLVMGLKMAFETKSILAATGVFLTGGMLGLALGLPGGVDAMAEAMRRLLGGGGRFNEGLVAASVLFCIGPMTLLGCIQDGLERKIDLLALKSTLDFFAALFMAVSLGAGVLASALVVLVFQGALTLSARALRPLADRPALMRETSALGGLILMVISLNLLELKSLPSVAFLPSLVLAPFVAALLESRGAFGPPPEGPPPAG